jgi:hypothetical protein
VRFAAPSNKPSLRRNAILAALGSILICPLSAANLTSSYVWKPVRIGAGGYVVGLSVSPTDPNAIFCRTDVGNAYRWNSTSGVWTPMRVRNADGTGIHGSDPSAPDEGGEVSVVVDPNNSNTIYMAFPTVHSNDVGGSTGVNVYKSIDGGVNFVPEHLDIPGDANSPNRADGERLAVDPNNSGLVYYGSQSSGVYRSLNGGVDWKPVTGNGAPGNVEIIDLLFYKGAGTTSAFGKTVSKVVYACAVNGDVYRSGDGGRTWTNISAGTGISGLVSQSSVDQNGRLYVAQTATSPSYTKAFWRYNGNWKQFIVNINQPVDSVVVDPSNSSIIWVVAVDGSLARSSDGGATWFNLGSLQFANTLGWLPQTVGMTYPWRSVGGIRYDAAGNLWICCGQEGMLTYRPTDTETSAAPPKWTIASDGIEELVTDQVVDPPGSGDTLITASMDTTGFTIPDPDDFSAQQIPLQTQIISQGSGVAFCPDAPTYVAVSTSNTANLGPNQSGYSSDEGKTWTEFGPAIQYSSNGQPYDTQSGSIAVSARGDKWGLGADHIVTLPINDFVPQWSHDGGQTWHATTSFPTAAGGLAFPSSMMYWGFWNLALHQLQLMADPFTPDKFYLKLTHAPDTLYVSTDGGQTWTGQPNAGLPDYTHHGQLAMNFKVQNDLWFVDGFEGATNHGVWHSTDGGATFQQVAGFAYADCIALGGGRSGSATSYAVYVYGKLTGSADWGVFRSTDAGATWDRISDYPTGIYDRPDCMAASWQTFGKVYVGFSGNSWVYGMPQ